MGNQHFFNAQIQTMDEKNQFRNHSPRKSLFCRGMLLLITVQIFCTLFLYNFGGQMWQEAVISTMSASWNCTLRSWVESRRFSGSEIFINNNSARTLVSTDIGNVESDDSEGDPIEVIESYIRDHASYVKENRSFTVKEPEKVKEPEPECGYLILGENGGRLGNQMFVYASFFGHLHRRPVPDNKTVFQRVSKIPSDLGRVFGNMSITPRILKESWYTKRGARVIRIGDRLSATYDDSGLDITHACDGMVVEYTGFRQSYKYFQNWSEEIRQEFTFRPEIRKKAQMIFDSVKRKLDTNCVTIGVHLRRGDFLEVEKINFGYTAADLDYFERAVKFFQNQMLTNSTLGNWAHNSSKCLAFLVFGNDYGWNKNASDLVQSRLENSNQTHFFNFKGDNSNAAVDMCVMTICDHVITSTGTFSWWIGFLNGGIVTYQKEYAIPNSFLYSQINPDDLFPPDWIGL